MILAPLRGVTIRCFREVFAEVIREVGFTEAITPFICANPGFDPLKDRELRPAAAPCSLEPKPLLLTPQFIGKDPAALRFCLERIKAAGFTTADLNCGCPFPMVRNKGRGSGILRTPDTLRRMMEVGCEVMGAGRFSVKTRLGVERPDELLRLMPLINEFPLRFLTVHARTAKQMYDGPCDWAAFDAVARVAAVPLVMNGDLAIPVHESQISNLKFHRGQETDTSRSQISNFTGDNASCVQHPALSTKHQALSTAAKPPSTKHYELSTMIGRSFLRALGERADIGELLDRYVAASRAELCGERPVLGRVKELLAYWQDSPTWRRRWQIAKLARTLDEIRVWR